MTIKIIKEGKTGKFTKTCPNCGCKFEYEQGDTKYGTYVICPCCGKDLPHNGYVAYYNNPNVKGYINAKCIDDGTIISYCDNCPNKPDPKNVITNVITGDSPCNWCIKKQYTYK